MYKLSSCEQDFSQKNNPDKKMQNACHVRRDDDACAPSCRELWLSILIWVIDLASVHPPDPLEAVPLLEAQLPWGRVFVDTLNNNGVKLG